MNVTVLSGVLALTSLSILARSSGKFGTGGRLQNERSSQELAPDETQYDEMPDYCNIKRRSVDTIRRQQLTLSAHSRMPNARLPRSGYTPRCWLHSSALDTPSADGLRSRSCDTCTASNTLRISGDENGEWRLKRPIMAHLEII